MTLTHGARSRTVGLWGRSDRFQYMKGYHSTFWWVLKEDRLAILLQNFSYFPLCF